MMKFSDFIKSRTLGEYLEARKNPQVRSAIQERTWTEVLLDKIATTKVNSQIHQKSQEIRRKE